MVKIQTNSPGDVIAALPYQFGYQPSECVVLVGLLGKRLHAMMRLDTPPVRLAAQAAQSLRHALASEPLDVVWIIAYEPVRGRAFGIGDSKPLVSAIRELLGDLAIPVGQEFVVRDQSWFCRHPECRDPGCPTEAAPASLSESTAAVAEFVGLGMAPLSSREELTGQVIPRPGEPTADPEQVRVVANELLEASAQLRAVPPSGQDRTACRRQYLTRLDQALSAWSDLFRADAGDPIIEADVVWLLGSLRDRDFRDGLISWMNPGSLGEGAIAPMISEAIARHLGPPLEHQSGDDGESGASAEDLAQVSLLTDRLAALCRRCPEQEAAPALTVAAAFWWWRGHGTEAGNALERALDLEPQHTLAGLLNQLVMYGVRPSKVRGLMAEYDREGSGDEGSEPPGGHRRIA